MRRYAPYADPLLLPIVALLNGLGLVLIHRLDLADAENAVYQGLPIPSPDANQQVLWTALAVGGFVAVLIFLRDYRLLARYSYTVGLAGLVLLAIRRCCRPGSPRSTAPRSGSDCPDSASSPASSRRSC